MKNNLLGLIIGLTLAIIIAGSVLAPSIAGIQSDNFVEYTNDGSAAYTINGVEDFSIYNNSSNGRLWIINGESVTINEAVPLVTTDQFVFEKTDANGRYMKLRDSTGTVIDSGNATSVMFKIIYTASTNTAVFTKYTDLTGETVDVTYTYSCSHVIEYDPDGDYTAILTNGDSDVDYYVNSANQIYAGGAYTSGDLDTAYFAQGGTVTLGEASYTGSAAATIATISGIVGVYKGSAYAVSVTDGSTTETFTPYTVYVPETVTGHTNDQSLQNTLYGVIIAVTIVGIVGFAAVTLYRKD